MMMALTLEAPYVLPFWHYASMAIRHLVQDHGIIYLWWSCAEVELDRLWSTGGGHLGLGGSHLSK